MTREQLAEIVKALVVKFGDEGRVILEPMDQVRVPPLANLYVTERADESGMQVLDLLVRVGR